MKKKIIIIVVVVLLVLGFSLFLRGAPVGKKYIERNGNVNKTGIVKINDAVFKVDISDTKNKRNKGLSERSSLNGNSGMLFVFKKSGIYSFWMKDMNFPIDIIWINKNFKIVYIKENATPKSYPNFFKPQSESMYVLEINAGKVEKDKIKIGDGVILSVK